MGVEEGSLRLGRLRLGVGGQERERQAPSLYCFALFVAPRLCSDDFPALNAPAHQIDRRGGGGKSAEDFSLVRGTLVSKQRR